MADNKKHLFDWLDMSEEEKKNYWYQVAMGLKRKVIDLQEEVQCLKKQIEDKESVPQ